MKDTCLTLLESKFDLELSEIQELQRTWNNDTGNSCTLTESRFLSLSLPSAFCHLTYFTSSWGQEFTHQEIQVTSCLQFKNDKGRCSAESAPFFTLASEFLKIDFAVCTSGNYQVSVTTNNEEVLLSIEDTNSAFSTLIPSGEAFSHPMILAHVYSTFKEGYAQKQQYRRNCLPSHPFYETLPIIYNHWWAYEDSHINEKAILTNASIAQKLGAEMLVLDAGWFGHDSLTEDWYTVRGDWDLINKERFPHGLTWLKESINALGLQFGIWCEIEGLGKNAELLKGHPEYAAVRDGENLGYVCFGNPQVQEWANQTMRRLFEQCSACYWKLDFNLDPGAGCNCTAHGHGTQDGLVHHYKGLYHVLDRLRNDFPNLVIENCSSGGQRLNLEMAEHTHLHFLSDPDYSTHQMRIFKEASKWLLPKQLLHFMWSNTVTTNDSAPFENLDLDAISPEEIRYHMRLAMMHPFGISHRLTDYSSRTLALIHDNLSLYKKIIRPFITDGEYLPVYFSDHINIFSFRKDSSILLFLFAAEIGSAEYELDTLLEPEVCYCLTDLDTMDVQKLNAGNKTEMCRCFTASARFTSVLILIRKESDLSQKYSK